MSFRMVIFMPEIALASIVFTAPVFAGTIQTMGPGSAVVVIDRSTTFDNLNFAGGGTPLSDYQSGGLYVRTNGNSYYGDDARGTILTVGTPFNPFHLSIAADHSYVDVGGGFYFPYDADPGNYDWVTIQTTDGRKIYGVEFLYGNGWTTGDIWGAYPWGNNSAYLDWKTLVGGTVVSSGQVGIFETLAVGSVVGFRDPNGFDQLMVRAPHPNAANPSFQELAIDDLKVSLSLGGTVPSTVLFLNNSRFKVEVNWSIPTGASGLGTAIPLTSDSGYFWFFSDSNIELLVKILDGRGVNGYFWVFYGSMTDVQYNISVTDTLTGAVKNYQGLQGTQESGNDIYAFSDTVGAASSTSAELKTAPEVEAIEAVVRGMSQARAEAAAIMAATDTALYLNGNRFKVEVAWSIPSGVSGQGVAIPLTTDSGYFWFFANTNVELLVKVLDGRGVNGHFWFFWGALTDVQYTITVTNTQTGAVRTYQGVQGVQNSGNDINVF